MTADEKIRMVEMFESGWTYEEIADELCYSAGTLKEYLAMHYSPTSMRYVNWQLKPIRRERAIKKAREKRGEEDA